MKYLVEFWTGAEWIPWTAVYDSAVDAWSAIHERRFSAPHLKRRVREVEA
jgi:hypothetical protein